MVWINCDSLGSKDKGQAGETLGSGPDWLRELGQAASLSIGRERDREGRREREKERERGRRGERGRQQ